MQEHSEDLKESFLLFDGDGDGYLTLNEFESLVRVLGVVMETSAIANTYNSNSKVRGMSYELFISCFPQLKTKSFNKDEIKNAINVLDKDKKGFIPAIELRRILSTIGDNMEQKEITDLFVFMGIDEQGVVKVDDFINQLMGVFK
ncbi:calmodulin, putative [Entamoeba dispar SAW760]|uniref:Calmodulin, putative n=1 Tax=Entamoeba dispar (strain ATCC PRA-260 / SAW760) TaxID=370354 RepID=B0EHG4_ENTDS|nr:calmodulin, putative [Entamoeba dispar SAW760]EDR26030.1 calmodulin, putative [Entamoeba dispar SAW760]|eukprot:EDR26030.1 calmodulin, putative [Entamoeba dispar SAW760]